MKFPEFSIRDMVAAEHELAAKVLGFVKSLSDGVRAAPCADHEVVDLNASLIAVRERDALIASDDVCDRLACLHRDPLALEATLDAARDVDVLAWQQPVDYLDQPHLRAEAGIARGDLSARCASADNGQNHVLLPVASFKDYQPPKPTLPRSPGQEHGSSA